MKIYVLYNVFLCRTYRGKGKDKTPLHNKHRERLYSSENQQLWVLTGLVPLGTTASCPGYHDITLGVPSEKILLNVHIIKDKP